MQYTEALIDADILVYKTCFGVKGDFIMMVEAVDHFVDWIEGMFGVKPQLFLTGKDNFRYEVATIKPYKGNRISEKPRYFKAVKDYMVEFHGAKISEGCECDDVLASRARHDNVLISTDKDFLTIANTHIFNPTKNELLFVSEEKANYQFYYQLLVGDTADNIPGIAGIGPVKAQKALADKTKEEMEEVVQKLYDKQYGEDAARALQEIKTLLWLRRDCADKVV